MNGWRGLSLATPVSMQVEMCYCITSMVTLTRPLIWQCSNRMPIARHLPVLAYPHCNCKSMRTLPSTPSARIVTTILLHINQRPIRHVLGRSSGLQSRKTFSMCRKAVIQGDFPTSSIMCGASAYGSSPERGPEKKVDSKRSIILTPDTKVPAKMGVVA